MHDTYYTKLLIQLSYKYKLNCELNRNLLLFLNIFIARFLTCIKGLIVRNFERKTSENVGKLQEVSLDLLRPFIDTLDKTAIYRQVNLYSNNYDQHILYEVVTTVTPLGRRTDDSLEIRYELKIKKLSRRSLYYKLARASA